MRIPNETILIGVSDSVHVNTRIVNTEGTLPIRRFVYPSAQQPLQSGAYFSAKRLLKKRKPRRKPPIPPPRRPQHTLLLAPLRNTHRVSRSSLPALTTKT